MACVPRQDCLHIEQLFSIRESDTSPRKRDQARDMLRGLECDRKKMLFCCYRQTSTNNGKYGCRHGILLYKFLLHCLLYYV